MLYRNLIMLMLLLLTATRGLAASVETHTIAFNQSDYTLKQDSAGNISIISQKAGAYTPPGQPAIPIISKRIAIPAGLTYDSSTATIHKRLIKSNVTMAFDSTLTEGTKTMVFPENVCRHVHTTKWDDLSVMIFLVSPFIYDSQNRSLYFIDSIDLTVNLKEKPAAQLKVASETPRRQNRAPDYVRSSLMNPTRFDSIHKPPTINRNLTPDTSRVQYLIVTNEALKESFEPLVKWKRAKGYLSRIVTVEELFKNLIGGRLPYEPGGAMLSAASSFYDSKQLHLKKYLFDMYNKEDGLQYVLFGGDERIVPAQFCPVKSLDAADSWNIRSDSITTDMYYACFDEAFDWDANQNGIIGEPDDELELTPNIYLTRALTNTPEEVKIFVDRVLAYEQAPVFNNNFLLAGKHMYFYRSDGKSDAQYYSEQMYNPYLNKDNGVPTMLWDGKGYKFFDTETSFGDVASYPFTSENLIEQLSKGYSFVHMYTHGLCPTWTTDRDFGYKECAQIKNPGHTIIGTVACYTNTFDYHYDGYGNPSQCLSKALLNLPNSGVVAYIGYTKSSWVSSIDPEAKSEKGHTRTFIDGPAYTINKIFFDDLFCKEIEDKNFGKIVAGAKSYSADNCYGDYSCARWVQFGLNPIGDPEMPIFVTTPKVFDKAKVTINPNYDIRPAARLNTGVADCRVCIMSKDDDGASYYEVRDSVQNMNLPKITQDCIITITKQGYIPKQITLKAFKDIKVNLTNNAVDIITGVSGSTIVITPILLPNNFNVQTFDGPNAIVTDMPTTAYVSVSHPEYMPKRFTIKILQSRDITDDLHLSADYVLIGSNITTKKENGLVNVSGGELSIKSNDISIDSEVIIGENANIILGNQTQK